MSSDEWVFISIFLFMGLYIIFACIILYSSGSKEMKIILEKEKISNKELKEGIAFYKEWP